MSFSNGSKVVGGRAYRQHTETKDYIRRKFNYTCQICGGYGKDVDHIIPWRESHDSTLANLRVLCHSCNCKLRKRSYASPSIEEWWRQLEQEAASLVTA